MITQATSPVAPSFSLEYFPWTWRGHTIYYTVEGVGQPIILIHGFGACIGHWRKNISVLSEAGYQVFALDLLGFGRSDKPAINYSLSLWEDLLRDFCTAHVQQPAVFAGNSIGALLALMMLADYPDLARGGILLNVAGGLNHRPEELNFPLRTVMGLFTRLVSSPLVGSFLFNQIRQKSRIRSTLKQVYRDHTSVTDELVDMLYEPSCDPGAQQVFASILTAPPGPKPDDLLPKVTQPLLVVWGAADPWTPISGATIYRTLAATAEHVDFIPIPNVGHCPHDECPDQVNQFMLAWLAKQS